MRGTSLLLGLALAGMTYFAQAATPATPPAPTIAIHGKAIVLPGAAHQPDPNMRQRAVFSLTVAPASRSEEHTSAVQSLMRISYSVFCWKKKRQYNDRIN